MHACTIVADLDGIFAELLEDYIDIFSLWVDAVLNQLPDTRHHVRNDLIAAYAEDRLVV